MPNTKWWDIGSIWQKIFNEGSSKIKVETTVIDSLPSGTNTIGKTGIDTSANTVKIDSVTNTIKDNDAGNSATGVTIPTGGLGKLGWLSGIYDRLLKVVLAPGTAIIGKVGIDQSTPGTTNGVQIVASIPAGTNAVGTVEVTALPSIPSGSNVIGKMSIDQTTQGVTNGVQIVGPLPNQKLVEQLTNDDAVAGVLTFFDNISCVEIYNTDVVNAGVFIVNGISITIPPDKVLTTVMGGMPSPNITVTGATTYIVTRYE